MPTTIKEKFIQSGAALTSRFRVLSIGEDGKAYYASYNSGAYFGVMQNAVTGANELVNWAEPGKLCRMTAGNTITGGDYVYVDNTGSGMVSKWTYTGTNWQTSTGGDIGLSQQLRDFPMVVGTCVDGAASGGTFWAIFKPNI